MRAALAHELMESDISSFANEGGITSLGNYLTRAVLAHECGISSHERHFYAE
jgi:hypothetical protein